MSYQYPAQNEPVFHICEPAQRRYYSQMPNIIDDLGLSIYAYRLYGHLKRVAGDQGKCFQSVTTMAEICGMSRTKLIEAKKELEQPIPKFGGKGLIYISKQAGFTDKILIVDIWEENEREFQNSNKNAVVHHVDGGSPPHGLGVVHAVDSKKNPTKNNQKQQTANNQKSEASSQETSKDSVAAVAVFSCLKNIQMAEEDKLWISKTYKEQDVKNAIAWALHPETEIKTTLSQAIKWACKAKPDVPGQFTQQALENKNWSEEFAKNCERGGKKGVVAGNTYLEIDFGGPIPFHLKYSEKNFVERVKNELRKRDLF